MSGVELARRLVDRANPIVVKEVRQAVRNKAYVALYQIVLFVCLAISLVACGSYVQTGNPQASIGDEVFIAFLFCLGITGIILMPMMAFQSMNSERTENAYELLSVSGLSPERIVRGKFGAILLQLTLLYSAYAPFMAFSYFLRGLDVVQMVYYIVASFWISACVAIVALAAGTLVTEQKSAGVSRAGFMVVLVIVAFTVVPRVLYRGFSRGRLPWTSNMAELFEASVVSLLISGSFVVVFYLVAVSRLTFAAGNRSTPLRVAMSLQSVLFACICAYYSVVRGFGGDHWYVYGWGMVLWWAAVGFWVTTEPDELSGRVRATVPAKLPYRQLLAPFFPGGNRGWLYLGLNLLFTLGVFYGATYLVHFLSRGWSGHRYAGRILSRDEGIGPLVFASYAIIYLGMVDLTFRSVLAPFRSPRIQRVCILGVVAASTLIPGLLDMSLHRNSAIRDLVALASPVWVLNRHKDLSIFLIIAAAGLMLLLMQSGTVIHGFLQLETIAGENAKRRRRDRKRARSDAQQVT